MSGHVRAGHAQVRRWALRMPARQPWRQDGKEDGAGRLLAQRIFVHNTRSMGLETGHTKGKLRADAETSSPLSGPWGAGLELQGHDGRNQDGLTGGIWFGVEASGETSLSTYWVWWSFIR